MNVTPDLDHRFREAALREGLIDVRYDVVESQNEVVQERDDLEFAGF